MLGLGTFLKPSLAIAWLKNRIQKEYGKPVYAFILRYSVELEKYSFQIKEKENGTVEKFGYKDEQGILAHYIFKAIEKDVPKDCKIDGFEFSYLPEEKSITIFYEDTTQENDRFKSINIKL